MTAGNVQTNIQNPISYGCAYFDGVDDFIQWYVPNTRLGEINNAKEITLCAQFKQTGDYTAGTDKYILRSTGQAIGFNGSNTGQVGFQVQEQDAEYCASGAQTGGLNQWISAIGVYSVSTPIIKIYVNGSGGLSATTPDDSVESLGTSQFRVGRSTGAEYFKGYIRDIRVYKRVLTAAEIARVANGELISEGLIFHAKLNGNSIDEISGNSGTVTGAVFVNDNDTIDTVFTAARSGATDKYLAEEINGQILTAVINET